MVGRLWIRWDPRPTTKKSVRDQRFGDEAKVCMERRSHKGGGGGVELPEEEALPPPPHWQCRW